MSTDTDYDSKPWAGNGRIREVKPAAIEPVIGNPANTKAPKVKRRSLLARMNAVVTLQVAGLAAIATAFGMWELPVGVGVGGLAALVLAWDMGSDRSGG